MGAPYAGADVFATDAVFPDDTDPPTASAFDVPLETAFDRTIWLKNRIDALVPLDNLTALAAILAPTDKMVRLVQKFGWYVFRGTGSSPFTAPSAFKPYAIAPADATPGMWVRAGNFRRFRERGVALTNFMVSNEQQFTTSSNRDKTTVFEHGARRPYLTGGSLAFLVFAQSASGAIRLPQAATSGGYSVGLQWCLDEVLSDSQLVSGISDKSTILSVDFGFWPATGRSALPTVTQAAIGVFRCPRLAGVGGLTSLFSGGDFVEVGAASVVDYEAPQAVPFTCDQNNVVDLAAYSYFAQVWNEEGANSLANNAITHVKVTVDNYIDAGIG